MCSLRKFLVAAASLTSVLATEAVPALPLGWVQPPTVPVGTVANTDGAPVPTVAEPIVQGAPVVVAPPSIGAPVPPPAISPPVPVPVEDESAPVWGFLGRFLGVAALVFFSAVTLKEAMHTTTYMPVGLEAGTQGKKPRIGAIDSLRFFLIAYIMIGHFIKFATENVIILRFFSQVNVVVGAFFVISGYVIGYVTTEIGTPEAIASKLQPPSKFIWGKIRTYYPLHFLVIVLFLPMFVYVDVYYGGLGDALTHAALQLTLTQSWFPLQAESWNAPMWFLSALTFVQMACPYVIPAIARMRLEKLQKMLLVLVLVNVIAKVAYTVSIGSFTCFEGLMVAKQHVSLSWWNTNRFHPFYAFLEFTMGVVAVRTVMMEDAPRTPPKTAFWALMAMLTLILCRSMNWVLLNDMLTRGVFFIPLWLIFLTNLHRDLISPHPSALVRFFNSAPLAKLGELAFPIFVVHQPVGMMFYKKVVATRLFGGVMGPSFFPLYLCIVVALAFVIDRCFLKRKDVQACFGAVFDRLQNGCGGHAPEQAMRGEEKAPLVSKTGAGPMISFDQDNNGDDIDIPAASWAVGLDDDDWNPLPSSQTKKDPHWDLL